MSRTERIRCSSSQAIYSARKRKLLANSGKIINVVAPDAWGVCSADPG